MIWGQRRGISGKFVCMRMYTLSVPIRIFIFYLNSNAGWRGAGGYIDFILINDYTFYSCMCFILCICMHPLFFKLLLLLLSTLKFCYLSSVIFIIFWKNIFCFFFIYFLVKNRILYFLGFKRIKISNVYW